MQSLSQRRDVKLELKKIPGRADGRRGSAFLMRQTNPSRLQPIQGLLRRMASGLDVPAHKAVVVPVAAPTPPGSVEQYRLRSVSPRLLEQDRPASEPDPGMVVRRLGASTACRHKRSQASPSVVSLRRGLDTDLTDTRVQGQPWHSPFPDCLPRRSGVISQPQQTAPPAHQRDRLVFGEHSVHGQSPNLT